jgi:hypothetical protein
MSEIQTSTPEETDTLKDAFDDNLDMAANLAAKRMISETPVTPVEATTPPIWDNGGDVKPDHSRRNAVILGGVGALLIAGGIDKAVDLHAPDYSEETTTYTISEDNDGLYEAAESIPGSETVNTGDIVSHISTDPANIDVLKDGLQRGEQIVVPISINGAESSNE